MLKKLLVSALLLAPIQSYAMSQVCTKTFNQSQLNIMQKSYNAGKIKDYGWTLAAMSWQESSAGNKPLNWDDPSFGIFHANIKTVSARYKAKDQYEEFALATRLMYDFDFAVEAAVAELDYWKKVHKGNWGRMWGSYNAGWNKANGEIHTQRILKKIQFLKKNKCIDINSEITYDNQDQDSLVPDSL